MRTFDLNVSRVMLGGVILWCVINITNHSQVRGQEMSLGDPNVEMGQPPVPRSSVIKRVVWDQAVVRDVLGPVGKSGKRNGSDNFPITWAADGHLYLAYGDGYGFEPILPMKLGMGFAKVLDGPEGFKGVNIRSDGENQGHGRSGKKGSGMLAVDGVLYMWVFHADEEGGQSQLAHSVDGAKTWVFAPWKFAEFGLCAMINFGQEYAGARDDYVYTVRHWPMDQRIGLC
ncbi:MAG: hypothetical protein ACI8V2_005438 [Candidatus Latescibacterota bacterium]|jgi:hypothetical protein